MGKRIGRAGVQLRETACHAPRPVCESEEIPFPGSQCLALGAGLDATDRRRCPGRPSWHFAAEAECSHHGGLLEKLKRKRAKNAILNPPKNLRVESGWRRLDGRRVCLHVR